LEFEATDPVFDGVIEADLDAVALLPPFLEFEATDPVFDGATEADLDAVAFPPFVEDMSDCDARPPPPLAFFFPMPNLSLLYL
jgi:hypothetical protein